MREGQRGLCFVRAAQGGSVVLTTYGRSSGFCIDPIEKKPLHHFFPGSGVLSFGTAGCNLACKFCQNWDISKSRHMDTLMVQASPDAIVDAARNHGATSIAYTYNDPVIFHEYAVDVAKSARQAGIHSVAVTAGYICAEPRMEFFENMDAANIDLKGFNEKFYTRFTGAHLQPVLETLEYVAHHTDVWLELTTLLIPGLNDSEKEITALCDWIATQLSVDTPIHFSAFHPDYKLPDIPATPPQTLTRAREIALQCGLRYAYTGNVHDRKGGSTWCHGCGNCLIERDWYQLGSWQIDPRGNCAHCGHPCPGHFKEKPGDWGARRLPVQP